MGVITSSTVLRAKLKYMKTISFVSTVLLQLLFSSFKEMPSRKQNIDFKVKLAGTQIGTLVVEQWTETDITAYNLQSKVKVDLLFSIGVDESITDVFEGVHLLQSDHKRLVNNKVKAHNTVKKEGNVYVLKNKDQDLQKMSQAISATVLSIYFKEPCHGQKLLSHSFQQLLTIHKIGEGRYKLVLPNGNVTFFQYKKGRLCSVESDTNWGNIVFERVD